MPYNWQYADWPQFSYELSAVEGDLLRFADKAGQISGMLKGLPADAQTDAILQVMISEAMKTSEIEGQYLSRPDVMSSIQRHLGLGLPQAPAKDQAAVGAAQLMTEVRTTWDAPLRQSTLFAWHKMIMRGSALENTGQWRTQAEPMQVISGVVGKTKIHFEAPPSAQVPREMVAFLKWFNQSRALIKSAPVRAAIAHLYFESIHPFEDGNGRIGRAIAEKAISQGIHRPSMLSLSLTINAHRKAYYLALERAQKNTEITPWVNYFVTVVLSAQEQAEHQVEFTLRQAQFFDRHESQLNERQLKSIRKMSEARPEGFTGGMNARKYGSINNVSKATATRDLQGLVKSGAFKVIGAGRSVRYDLCFESDCSAP